MCACDCVHVYTCCLALSPVNGVSRVVSLSPVSVCTDLVVCVLAHCFRCHCPLWTTHCARHSHVHYDLPSVDYLECDDFVDVYYKIECVNCPGTSSARLIVVINSFIGSHLPCVCNFPVT